MWRDGRRVRRWYTAPWFAAAPPVPGAARTAAGAGSSPASAGARGEDTGRPGGAGPAAAPPGGAPPPMEWCDWYSVFMLAS